MASLSVFMLKVKPAMDKFFSTPDKNNLNVLQREISEFEFVDMRIFHQQILLPLLMNVEPLKDKNQDLRTGLIDCIRTVVCRLYLQDKNALRLILFIVLSQIRDLEKATMRGNVSEELKLAVVSCISEVLKHSTTDVLEAFYQQDCETLIGAILLTLVHLIELEKYRTLVTESLECLMVMFYVHDGADGMDVVLRKQVADMLFIYLPKILTVLIKTSLSDDKLGETLKTMAIRALARILCIIYETNNGDGKLSRTLDSSDFKKLVDDVHKHGKDSEGQDILYKKEENIKRRLERLKHDGRSQQWFSATSSRLRELLVHTTILRAHTSSRIRAEYANMCCTLLTRCASHLKENVQHLLESVVALSEDEELPQIREQCEKCLLELQSNGQMAICDEYCDTLFDEYLMRLPRIIKCGSEAEQYASLTFLKGFIRNLSAKSLLSLFSLTNRLEMFCSCLCAMAELQMSRNLLQEEYSLASLHGDDNEGKYVTSCKLSWRHFCHLSSKRCINAFTELCRLLGSAPHINQLVFEHLLAKFQEKHAAMIELLLILQFIAASDSQLNEKLLQQLLDEDHWNLELHADPENRIKITKPAPWFVDHTPGLYESAIEIRMQDCDSDDEQDNEHEQQVNLADAQYNILYTCTLLDALGSCARHLGPKFGTHIFRCLHLVLLKIACSITCVHEASLHAVIDIQLALGYVKLPQFIENHVDYIAHHINYLLKRAPESHAAVDILSVLLQFSAPKSLSHLSTIFHTILEACSQSHHADNIIAYLRVFHAFLQQIKRWEVDCGEAPQQLEGTLEKNEATDELLNTWLNVLSAPPTFTEDTTPEAENITNNNANDKVDCENDDNGDGNEVKETLPLHKTLVKMILQQSLKFVSSSNQIHQILALECLSVGLPLLANYDDELLPLVHLTWQPLIEKFRQRDSVVLQRCFELFNILATYAKDFLLKRSLNDIIPHLNGFLKESAQHSAAEHSRIKSQEYKLQLKLLTDYANLIISMDIEAKPLYDITETVAVYLSNKQPTQLQELAAQFFLDLRQHNCPLVYGQLLQKTHIHCFESNIDKLIQHFLQ